MGVSANSLRRVFVVTPVYNARRYIGACMKSVEDQKLDGLDLTHVIVDDCSTDGTWELIQSAPGPGGFTRLFVRSSSRTGSPLASVLTGLAAVSPGPNDIIFWLDGDDWLIDPEALATLAGVYADPTMDMAWGQHITFYGKDKPLGVGISRPVEERTLVRYKTVAFSHLRSFRYGMLEKVGPERLTDPDTGKPWHYAGDSALFLPMMEMARNVAFHPKPLYCYNRETQANEDKQGDYFASQNSVRVRALPPALNDVPEWYPEKRLPPTQRWRVFIGLGCDLSCQMCYFAHKKRVGFREWPDVEAELVAGLRRGNRFVDFSGGEPTLIKDLPRWITATRNLGLIPGIITHGQRIEPMLEDLWAAGLDDILFSVHGDEADHNRLTRTTEGFGKLWRAMTKCAEQGFAFRTNTVLVDNYKGLPALARKLARLHPFISNFINFQASWEWAEKPEGEIPFQARVSSIAPYLREAIDILTSAGTCVNVRYFPFCLLKGHEPLVVNDAQVMSDPFEWDYDVMPKTFEHYRQAGLDMAAKKYAAADSCGGCALLGAVCQGPHKQYLERFGGEELEPYDGAWITDPLHFRAQADPRQLFNLVGINWGWHYERSV